MREDAVAKSVSEIKTRIVDTGPDEAKLRNLEANARSKRAELDRLRAQFEGNRVRADDSRTIPVEAQIVSMARPSSVPVFPKKTATTLLVAVATLMFGMAIVITRGLLSGVRVPVAVEREPMRRTMPVAPVLPGLHRAPELAAAAEPPQGAAMHAFDLPAAIADRLRALREQALSGTRSLFAGDVTARTTIERARVIGDPRRRGERIALERRHLVGAGEAPRRCSAGRGRAGPARRGARRAPTPARDQQLPRAAKSRRRGGLARANACASHDRGQERAEHAVDVERVVAERRAGGPRSPTHARSRSCRARAAPRPARAGARTLAATRAATSTPARRRAPARRHHGRANTTGR